MPIAREIEIDFTAQQLELLDRLATKWGASAEEAAARLLEEAAEEAATSHDPGAR